MKIVRLILLCALLSCSVNGLAQPESVLRDASKMTVRLAGNDNPEQTKVYIVQLRTPPAVDKHVPYTKFDKNNPSVKAHAARLEQEQELVLAKAGPGAQKIYSYKYGLNGFAARMSVTQAQKREHEAEVLNIWEDEIRPMATRHSPSFLGLFDAENGLRSVEGLDGEGVVIGIIDSGISPEHPALQDTRQADMPSACRGSWAETTLLGRWLCGRYRKTDDVVVFDEPENWNGACIAGERFDADECNNKLIGARWFIDGAVETGPIDSDEIRSPRDADGHGTHTATTAAGNRAQASIFGTLIGGIEGIAPRARVAVYKACWLRPGDTRASCNTSDLANAIDSAVADGVDIINYSVGSSMLQITAPDDIALMNATKAGVLAVVAAGNEGPNLGTIGSPAGGPWAITVAASTRDGETSVDAMQINEPASIAGKYAVEEANFTPPLRDSDPIEEALILVDDDDDASGTGTTADACEPLINDADITGNIAFIE